MSRDKLGVVVLAAGTGSRMRSRLPKVLHPVCGLPMLLHVTAAATALAPHRLVVVVGHGQDRVRAALEGGAAAVAYQSEQLGTAHAVECARQQLADCNRIMVLNGDAPLITPALLERLRGAATAGCPITLATAQVAKAGRLGRILRDHDGNVRNIVEAADYSGDEGPAEINAGQYLFDAAWLWPHIAGVTPASGGERYLTALVHMAADEGIFPQTVWAEADEILGVDDRRLLARAESLMRLRILDRHMINGVTIRDPATTYVDARAEIASDVTILPGCSILGECRLESGAVVGPNTTLEAARIGPGTAVHHSVIEQSSVGARCTVGPFAHLRSNAQIGDDCELGNHAEVKNSRIGPGVKMHHFGYLGDADVGAGTNIAAGVITCNYDGVNKHRTTIGKEAFIGCDTMLVAPVTIGDRAFTAAGAVVTKDVPPGQRVAGVPAHPIAAHTERKQR